MVVLKDLASLSPARGVSILKSKLSLSSCFKMESILSLGETIESISLGKFLGSTSALYGEETKF